MYIEIGMMGVDNITLFGSHVSITPGVFINLTKMDSVDYIKIFSRTDKNYNENGGYIEINGLKIEFSSKENAINFLKFLDLKINGIDQSNIKSFAEILYNLNDDEMKYHLLKKFKNDFAVLANLAKELESDKGIDK